jgi:hypothetical protein
MKGRGLTGLLLVLGFGLAIVLFVDENALSNVMERCGRFISNGFGL